MHHSTGNAPSAQHTRALQQDVVLGCTRKERRTDRDLSWYMRLPPFVEKQQSSKSSEQAPASPGMRSQVRRKGSARSQALSGEGPAPLPPREGGLRHHTKTWWWALRSEAAAPRSAELRKTRGKVVGEQPGQQRVLQQGADCIVPLVLLLPARAALAHGTRCETPLCSSGAYPSFCPNAGASCSRQAGHPPGDRRAPQPEKGEEERSQAAARAPCSSVRTTIGSEGHTRAHTHTHTDTVQLIQVSFGCR